MRFKDRFQRYKESMFLFLEEDSIPWNNNTGERALRHLAVQRKISGFFFKSFASRYLVLLGIAQTCKFQEKSFLKFLLSGGVSPSLNDWCRDPFAHRPNVIGQAGRHRGGPLSPSSFVVAFA